MNFYVDGQEFKKNNILHGLQFSNETVAAGKEHGMNLRNAKDTKI